jgi:hypothetical protein
MVFRYREKLLLDSQLPTGAFLFHIFTCFLIFPSLVGYSTIFVLNKINLSKCSDVIIREHQPRVSFCCECSHWGIDKYGQDDAFRCYSKARLE